MDSLLREVMDVLHRAGKGHLLLGVYLLTATPILIWFLHLMWSSPKEDTVEEAVPLLKPKHLEKAPSQAATAALKLIRDRRTVFPKDYTGELVDRTVIEAMLEAANWAPTHGKTEPWRFVVFSRTAFQGLFDLTTKVLEESKDPAAAKRLAKFQSKKDVFAEKASHLIAICMKRQAKDGKLMPEWEEIAAVSCSVHNMHLVATAEGVAGYWSSWYTQALVEPEMKSYLGLEGEDRCLGFFFVGQSDAISSYRSKRGPIQEKVTWRE